MEENADRDQGREESGPLRRQGQQQGRQAPGPEGGRTQALLAADLEGRWKGGLHPTLLPLAQLPKNQRDTVGRSINICPMRE